MLQSLGSLVLLPFLSYKLRVPDTTIGVVASFSKILGLTAIGTSWLLSADSTFFILGQTEHLLHKLSKTRNICRLGYVCGMMGPQVSTVIWSLLSKTVPEADIGKVC